MNKKALQFEVRFQIDNCQFGKSNDASSEKLQRLVGELKKQPVSETENYASNEFPLPFALGT